MPEPHHDPDWELLLHGFADEELDAANALRCEQHIAACPACADELARLLALRQRLRLPGVAQAAPESLRRRVLVLDRSRAPARASGPVRRPSPRGCGGRPAALGIWSLVPSLAVLGRGARALRRPGP